VSCSIIEDVRLFTWIPSVLGRSVRAEIVIRRFRSKSPGDSLRFIFFLAGLKSSLSPEIVVQSIQRNFPDSLLLVLLEIVSCSANPIKTVLHKSKWFFPKRKVFVFDETPNSEGADVYDFLRNYGNSRSSASSESFLIPASDFPSIPPTSAVDLRRRLG